MIRVFCFFNAMAMFLIAAYCQEMPRQQFLFSNCYDVDSLRGKQVSYVNIGDVFLFDLFEIDDKISVKCFHSSSILTKREEIKYIKSIGETHLNIWANNTNSVKRKSLKIKGSWIYVVEINLAFENTTMQIISFKEREVFFEIIHFFSSESSSKDFIIRKLKLEECL